MKASRLSLRTACALLLGLLAACNEDAVLSSDVAPSFTQSPAAIFINELHYDNDGGDTGEAVEVAGPAGTDLSGWSVALYNGTESQRSVYGTIDLSGTIPDQDGGYGTLSFAETGIQNGGPDGLALVDDGGVLVQFLSYEGDFEALNGPAEGEASTDIGVQEGSGTPAGFSLQLVGVGTTYQDFTWASPSDDSFGSVNSEQSFGGTGGGEGGTGGEGTGGDPGTDVGECGDDATLISVVQGGGAESPLAGQTATVEGVVVGDFQDDEVPFSDLGGFYVQEEADDDDGDPTTSEGVFVFAPDAANVSQGDLVRVNGTVTEFNRQTQLTEATVQICGTSPLPEPVDVTLPLTSRDDLERLESMVVRFPQPLVIAEYFNYDRFGEIVLAQPPQDLERPYQPTSYVEPGSPAATEIAELNDLSRITLDDGRSTQNPDPARHPNGEAFTLDNRFRGGDTVQNAVGVLDYRFDLYRLQPTQGADYTKENPRPDVPEEVGGSLRVGSFNVLNYFTTFGERGADNQEEFERQRAKIIAALAEIDADIVGLVELENNGGSANSAIQDLANGLNDELGAGTYDFIETGVIGTDAITVGMIYKPETVTPVGDFAVLDDPSFTNPNDLDTPKNRPALAQTFREEATGGVLTIVANHFKSKGSPCGEGDDDPQQGSCNDTRLKAADALAKWLATDPTGSDDPDVLILGDLNAYDEEDPIDQLREGADDTLGTGDDYTDLTEAFEGEFAYSFVFSGEFGHLDYALANEALLPQVTGTTEWHINADEPDLLDYDTSFKQDAQDALFEPNAYRSSDHDPVIVGLELGDSATDTPPTCQGQEATVYVQAGVIVGGRDDGEAYEGVLFGTTGDDVIVGTPGDDDIRAQQGDDLVCAGEGDDHARGNAGDDVIFGEDGNDQLSGDRGDLDRLFGGEGDDRIIDRRGGNLGAHGGPGDDRINVSLQRGWRDNSARYDGKLSGGYGDDFVTLESEIPNLFINVTGDERDDSPEEGARDRLILKGEPVSGGSVIIKFEQIRR